MRDLSGKIFYGLHFQQGVAEYKDMLKDDGTPTRIYINSETARRMDPSFAGKPVFVHHKDDISSEDFQEADGYVVESFFNKADGNHWAKFIVTTENGYNSIKNGMKLSNAYFRRKELGEGKWHGVEYDSQVMEGDYEHLAIVDDPRYEESIVLTPDEFKAYNLEKDTQLLKLANSKKVKTKNQGDKGMFNFYKREKVENSAGLENMVVTLPRCNKEVTILDLIRNEDEKEMKKDEETMANSEDMVKVGDEKMSVNELVEKYEQACKSKNEDDEEKAKNEEEEEKKKESMENMDDEDKAENEDDEEVENEDDEEVENEDDEEVENKDDEEEVKNKKSKNSNFNKLKNAHKIHRTPSIDLSQDKLARGQARYGSN